MITRFKRWIDLTILVGTLILSTGKIVLADGPKTVGVVAISYQNNVISSVSAAIAVGKTSAAGTASITATETAASAIGSAGQLTVTNPNTTSVGYQVDADTNLGTAVAGNVTSDSTRITNLDGNNSKAVTVMP
jgi:hypothetical protein